MAISNQRGFTLIEIVLVIAITGALLTIAFAGQGQIRGRAHFDAAVNKIVSSINDAHNQATAGVNTVGAGDGSSGCTPAAAQDFVFAGVAWIATGPGNVRMDYYKVIPQSTQPNDGCVFLSQSVALPAPVRFNITNTPSFQGGREVFIRSNDILNICPVPDSTVDIEALFKSGNCTEGTLTLNISDDDGRQGQVIVDKSGLAQRKF
jgi:prepilin-type N-terminal cleavage/methylation domain-containing protein